MNNSISIFGFTIYFYSLCILLGIFIAYYLINKEAKKNNIDKDFIFNLVFYGIIFGILGARIYYVIFSFDYYKDHLADIIKVWNGGLAIHGGIISGLIFVYYYCKKKKQDFIKIIDIIVPGLIIAQAFGRWGNFFNQEAYGMMVSKKLLQKMLIPGFIINGMYINGSYYLPTFYIESIWCLIGVILMIIIRNKIKIKKGTLTAFYLIWYGVGRLVIEYFRTDSLMFFGLKQAQIISIISIIIGLIILFNRKRELYKE